MPGKVFRMLSLWGGAYGGSQLQNLGSDCPGSRYGGCLYGKKQ